MRVKTPWIDALTQSRESEKNDPQQTRQTIKPDLTPKKMSDSYYSAVCISFHPTQQFSFVDSNLQLGSSSGPR